LLADREIASLHALREAPVTHVDLAPTILDLLGLDAPMAGTSLLRSPARDRTAMMIATCNELWSCFVPVWGKLIGDRKWLSRPQIPEPQCFDTIADPEEKHDLGAAACSQ
jgi:arylsulfatase A-like enzyme